MTKTQPQIPAADKKKPKRRRELLGAEAALAKCAFDAATTPENRELLMRGKAVVVVVHVPGQAWVTPISTHLGSLAKDAKRIARDGSQKTKDLPCEGNDQVLAALAESRCVIGISQAPSSYLPSALQKAADVTIRVDPPDGATLMRAIALCVGGRAPTNPPKDLAAGLDFVEIASALRPGSTPTQVVGRLESAVKGRSNNGTPKAAMPTLQEAVFYGAAREWGLALAVDVEEAKKSGDWSGVDRGACFYGPPGTGKTFLARIIAAACKLPIIECSVADLFANSSGYLDGVVKAQRAVFAKAAALAPCCVLWDECEAMPSRSKLSPRGRDWWLPVVDDFLMGVSNSPRNVIIFGCTNHLDLVEEGLLRPDRMERAIEIKPAATAEGLAMILRFHLSNDLAGENLVPLARMGLGATAAEAMEMVRRARRAARTAKRAMVLADLAAVIAPPDDRPLQSQKQAATHESAHAVITLRLGAEALRSVSIIGRDGSGGRMQVRLAPAPGTRGREHFENIAVGILAGRAAELLLCDGATAGAGGHPQSDLAIVSRICAAVHASLGLADSLLYRGAPDALETTLMYDPALRAAVEADMKRLHKRAEELVLEHRLEIEAVAEALIERRHLEADEVRRIVDRTRAQADAPKLRRRRAQPGGASNA